RPGDRLVLPLEGVRSRERDVVRRLPEVRRVRVVRLRRGRRVGRPRGDEEREAGEEVDPQQEGDERGGGREQRVVRTADERGAEQAQHTRTDAAEDTRDEQLPPRWPYPREHAEEQDEHGGVHGEGDEEADDA